MIVLYCLACFAAGVIGTLVCMLVFGCPHNYDTKIHKVDHMYSDGTYRCTTWLYTNTCKHCGKVKVKEVASKK